MQKLVFILGLSILVFRCTGEQDANSESHMSDTTTVITEVLDTIAELDTDEELILTYQESIAKFANAVINDDIDGVSNFISYPLKRETPLAAIQNVAEFKSYYPTLFDNMLKEKLVEHLDLPDFIDQSGSNGTIGILSGLIWFDQVGSTVVAINYQSETEKINRAAIDDKVRNSMHPILKEYTHNVYLGRTEEGLFRIDETEKGLRYASWYGSQNLVDEPDFILWNGVSERQGTAGGWTTTFDNVDTKYILDEVFMCADEADCGTFLLIQDEGEITSKLTVTEILNPLEEIVPRQD